MKKNDDQPSQPANSIVELSSLTIPKLAPDKAQILHFDVRRNLGRPNLARRAINPSEQLQSAGTWKRESAGEPGPLNIAEPRKSIDTDSDHGSKNNVNINTVSQGSERDESDETEAEKKSPL
jgi:hypothetical protein